MTPFLDPPEIGCSEKSKKTREKVVVEPLTAKKCKKVQKVVQNGVWDPILDPPGGCQKGSKKAFLPKTVFLGFSGKRVKIDMADEWRDEWSQTQKLKNGQKWGTLNRTVYRIDPKMAKIGSGTPSGGPKMTHFWTPQNHGFAKFRAVNTRVEPRGGSKKGSKKWSKMGPRGGLGPKMGHFWTPSETPSAPF